MANFGLARYMNCVRDINEAIRLCPNYRPARLALRFIWDFYCKSFMNAIYYLNNINTDDNYQSYCNNLRRQRIFAMESKNSDFNTTIILGAKTDIGSTLSQNDINNMRGRRGSIELDTSSNTNNNNSNVSTIATKSNKAENDDGSPNSPKSSKKSGKVPNRLKRRLSWRKNKKSDETESPAPGKRPSLLSKLSNSIKNKKNQNNNDKSDKKQNKRRNSQSFEMQRSHSNNSIGSGSESDLLKSERQKKIDAASRDFFYARKMKTNRRLSQDFIYPINIICEEFQNNEVFVLYQENTSFLDDNEAEFDEEADIVENEMENYYENNKMDIDSNANEMNNNNSDNQSFAAKVNDFDDETLFGDLVLPNGEYKMGHPKKDYNYLNFITADIVKIIVDFSVGNDFTVDATMVDATYSDTKPNGMHLCLIYI